VSALRGIAALGLAVVLGCGGAETPVKQPAASTLGEVRVTNDRLDGTLWLGPVAERARRAGGGPLRVVASDVASEGDHVGGFVEVPEGQCVLVLARGSPTVSDVDLFVYEDDGDPFATDESPAPEASALLCPPHPRRLYAVGRATSGVGAVAVGVLGVAPELAAAVGAAAGVRGREADGTGRLDAWPGLEARVHAHRQGLGGVWEDQRRVALAVTSRAATRLSFVLEEGRCADVFVAPSDEVGSLEAVVEDADGRIVARAKTQGRERTLVLCSATREELTLALRPRGSQGLVAVVLGRSQVGAERELSESTPIARVSESRPLAAVIAAHDRALLEVGLGSPTLVAKGTAKVGSRSAFSLELPAGCARIDVLAGHPLALVEASLWDAQGTRLTEARGAARATLFTCGTGGPARIDLEAEGRPGPFAIQLRKTQLATPALVAHPIAAGRLLGRLYAGGQLGEGNAPVDVDVVSLDDASRRTLTKKLTTPGCLDAVTALDRGAAGVDVRIADASSGESSLAAARYVVANRLCSPQDATPLRVELTVATGRAEALVWLRESAAR
jgi:hypothetical protein